MKYLLRYIYRQRTLRRNGFTLLELLTVVAIVATLMAIAAPGWLRFLDTQRLISAQGVVYQGMQRAQSKAQQTRAEWNFSIRDLNGSVEWSVHSTATPLADINWESLGAASIQLDTETTLQLLGSRRTIRFDHKGNVVSTLGRVTLSSRRFGEVKRCVYASTIIGALRQSKEQKTPYKGDFCY